MSRNRLAAALIAVFMALTMVACGDSDSSGEEGAVGAQSGGEAASAADQGKADAKEPVELPKRTLGYLQYTNEAEIARRMQAAAEEAAKAIGWDFLACDGQGDPRKQGACGSTLLDRGADVILANTIPPAATKRALQTADEKDIPWIVVGGLVEPDPLVDAIYPPDDKAMSAELSKWLTDEMGAKGELAILNNFPGIEGYKLRVDALREEVSGQDGIEIVAEEEIDYTNLVEDVRRDVSQTLSKSPNLSAIFSVTNDIPPIVSGLKGAGKTAEDGPILTGFFADQANLDAIRSGMADAIAEWPIEGDIWASVDKAAQLLARDEQLPEKLVGAYDLEFTAPLIVTSDNLPAEGEYPPPKSDFVSYFKAKWSEEFQPAPGS